MAQYEAAMGSPAVISPTPKYERAQPHTWKWLCQQYMASSEFKGLAGSTPDTRRRNLEWTWKQPINSDRPTAETFGEMPIAKMTPDAIYILRDRKAGNNSEHRAAANLLLKIIGYAFKHGVDRHRSIVSSNPVRDVQKLRHESTAHHTWTQAELRQFLRKYRRGSKERRAMSLMLFTGARGCDARKFGPAMVKEGWLKFHQQKLVKKARGWVELPLHEELVRELEGIADDALAFVLTPYGKAYSQKGFGNWFNAKCREAGLEDCTAHGLRRAAATIAADRGANVFQLMATFGWMTEQQAIHYTTEADRKKHAAATVPLISVEMEGDCPTLDLDCPTEEFFEENPHLMAGVALPTGIEPVFQP